MVVTDDSLLRERLLALRQHGQSRPGSNVHESFGLNWRPSEIHALLGLRVMAKAERILTERRRAAAVYDRLLVGCPATPVKPPAGQRPSYYKYMLLTPEGVDRDRVKARLRDEFEVSLAGEVYSVPLHRQPLWLTEPERLAAPPGDLPNAEMVAARQICLPIWPGLTEEAQEFVVDSLNRVLRDG
jgi:dTDP-4-amino-4,6-dideoxygalactose transaminase